MLKLISRLSVGVCALALFSGCIEVTSTSPELSKCNLASFSTPPLSGKELGIAEMNYGGTSVAQSFVLNGTNLNPTDQTGSATIASVLLIKKGTISQGTHTLIATIEESGTYGPNDKPLGKSSAIDPFQVSNTVPTYYSFKFNPAVQLKPSKVYWLRIKATYPLSDKNFIAWAGFDGKTSGYYNGDTPLSAVYEQSSPGVFATSLIGAYRFLLFKIGC